MSSPATRRSALASAAAAGAALLLPRRAAAEPNLSGDIYDVVIVGAGAAGIGAAWSLRESGAHNFVLLEAADRIGGRAYTDSATFGFPFDIGCAWIHGAKHPRNRFAAFAREWGYVTHDCGELGLDRLYFSQSGGPGAARGDLREFERAEAEIEGAVAAAPADAPVGRLLPHVGPYMEAAATYMGPMDAGADPGEISSYEIANMGEYAPNLLVERGYGTLVRQAVDATPASEDPYARYSIRSRTRLNIRVTKIELAEGGATRVHFRDAKGDAGGS